jgi:hypothetical protein
MNNSFDVNVLVNGNRCKFYHHQGKTYIQANHGSEYELEIKNNTWSPILCLSSVDGLNVLTGEPAREDDAGYIIPSYSPLRIKGFRYSNNEVAAFKFTDKRNSYAQSQGGNDAAQNCGVIGFKLYNEIVRTPIRKVDIQWVKASNLVLNTENINICCGGNTTSNTIHTKCCDNVDVYGSVKGTYASTEGTYNSVVDSALRDFDMGSTWGQKVESKVVETEFEKGSLTFSLDIYYASRKSLIDMGVPINVDPQVSFPQSFPGKYATPPAGWKG